MPAYKDTAKGTWYTSFYFEDWKGVRKKKLKRGFETKHLHGKDNFLCRRQQI